eukprot:COSAG02_NODE_3165_length_7245_cov_27.485586_5_plen_55_part_00
MVVVFFSQLHGHGPTNQPTGTLHNYNDDLRVAVNAAIVDDALLRSDHHHAFHRL